MGGIRRDDGLAGLDRDCCKLDPDNTEPEAWKRKLGVIGAIVGACYGAIYFNQGMDKYGSILNFEYLPEAYLQKVYTYPQPNDVSDWALRPQPA